MRGYQNSNMKGTMQEGLVIFLYLSDENMSLSTTTNLTNIHFTISTVY